MSDRPVAVSTVISTRDRGSVTADAVRSVLACEHDAFELIVVDQSADGATEEALRPLRGDPRLIYLRTPLTGLSRGRNVGAAAARGRIVAVTDDDCTVPMNWLTEVEAAFEGDRSVGVVFGNVLPGGHDKTAGTVTCYVRREPFLARAVNDKLRAEGIGACMAFRKEIWTQLGGFDEMLGAGAAFHAAEEVDFSLRALFAGHAIYETPRVEVVHHSFRTWEETAEIMRRYWYGTGAMLAKLTVCGRWQVMPFIFRLGWRWIWGESAVAAGLGGGSRFLRLGSFLRGFGAGLVAPVDRRRALFRRS